MGMYGKKREPSATNKLDGKRSAKAPLQNDVDLEAGGGSSPVSPTEESKLALENASLIVGRDYQSTSDCIAQTHSSTVNNINNQLLLDEVYTCLPSQGPDHLFHYQDGGLGRDPYGTERLLCPEDEDEEEHNEAAFYLASTMLARALPERFFALLVTLLFEIPVLLMISGGSGALCELIGRTRYQLMMGFIPLTSAISGNVGLQASTLTTRAISHRHVTSKSYRSWFLTEIGAAAYLGLGMGLLLGSIAFVASGMDMAFGITILIAQFISIVTAGVTGTFAPLLFSFFFNRDSGKWGGPLETAVQDIVGSFAMVIISYHILLFLGPGHVAPGDVCGGS